MQPDGNAVDNGHMRTGDGAAVSHDDDASAMGGLQGLGKGRVGSTVRRESTDVGPGTDESNDRAKGRGAVGQSGQLCEMPTAAVGWSVRKHGQAAAAQSGRLGLDDKAAAPAANDKVGAAGTEGRLKDSFGTPPKGSEAIGRLQSLAEKAGWQTRVYAHPDRPMTD
jgi:hypothetical protein